MDPYDARWTRRGTLRIVKTPEPETPTEGFCDLLGKDVFEALKAAVHSDVRIEPFTFLKRTARLACGFVQSGPRRIFFTLALKAEPEILCYGCDPVFATPPAKRIDYSFKPHIDPQWSFQMRKEVQQRFDMVRPLHEKQAVAMNMALHFGENPRRARKTWEAYAQKHGLVIIETEVDL